MFSASSHSFNDLEITPDICNPDSVPPSTDQMSDSGVRSHINMKPNDMFLASLVCHDDIFRGVG